MSKKREKGFAGRGHKEDRGATGKPGQGGGKPSLPRGPSGDKKPGGKK